MQLKSGHNANEYLENLVPNKSNAETKTAQSVWSESLEFIISLPSKQSSIMRGKHINKFVKMNIPGA